MHVRPGTRLVHSVLSLARHFILFAWYLHSLGTHICFISVVWRTTATVVSMTRDQAVITAGKKDGWDEWDEWDE
jgi:hypothetical protein